MSCYNEHFQTINGIGDTSLADETTNVLRGTCKTARQGLFKIAMPIFLWLVSVTITYGQGESQPTVTFWDDPLNHPLFPVFAIGVFVLFVLTLTVIVAVLALKVLKLVTEKAAKERAARLGVPYVEPLSPWEKFWEKANAMVPMEDEQKIELDHNYDGIRELDNHLPPWWKGLFYGCIVFAFVYMTIYHLSNSFPLSEQEYQDELVAAETQQRILRASKPPELIDENALVYNGDEAIVLRGKGLYISNNCGSCHRNDGGGNAIGPNLTDEYWLHGGNLKNVFSTIRDGVVEKAMPAWGKVMSQKDVRDLAFYVMSLQGTQPENAKKPQGEVFKPSPVVTATDTTQVSMMK